MKMVILDGYTLNPGDNPWDEIRSLVNTKIYDRTDPNEILLRARDNEILATNKTPISAEIMEKLPELKYILVLATGFDCIDVKAAAHRGITVCNVPEYGTESVAELVMTFILEMARRPALHDVAVKNGEWSASPDWCFWKTPLIELTGKKLGIVGFGRIGRRVGQLAKAFGMKILANDPYQKAAPVYAGFEWAEMNEIFDLADFITLHCNQNDQNKGFVNRALLTKMKKTAFLINTSRGGLVNEQDLASALNSGQIAGAALDVVSIEPIRPEIF